MVTGHVTVFENGKVDRPSCSRRGGSSTKHEDEPTTEVAIRRAAVRGPLSSCWPRTTPQHAEGDLRGHDQPARELDLVRVRGDGARDRARAAARERVRVRGLEGARRGAVDDLLLLLFLLLPVPLRAQHVEDGRCVSVVPRIAARTGSEERDHLHVRLPPVAGQLRHAELRRGTRRRPRKMRQYRRGRQGPRADLRRLHSRSSASQESSRVAGRQRLQPAGVAVPVSDRRVRRREVGVRRVQAGRVCRGPRSPRGVSAGAGEDAALRERLDDELRDLD